jgi:hypothetical protein
LLDFLCILTWRWLNHQVFYWFSLQIFPCFIRICIKNNFRLILVNFLEIHNYLFNNQINSFLLKILIIKIVLKILIYYSYKFLMNLNRIYQFLIEFFEYFSDSDSQNIKYYKFNENSLRMFLFSIKFNTGLFTDITSLQILKLRFSH